MPTIKKVKPEQAVQMALVEWLCLQYPKYSHCIIKISNENAFRGNAVKMGYHPGASDLLFCVPRGTWHALFIEIKPETYKIVPSNLRRHRLQIDFINDMTHMGYYACMCIGLDDCIKHIQSYMRL